MSIQALLNTFLSESHPFVGQVLKTFRNYCRAFQHNLKNCQTIAAAFASQWQTGIQVSHFRQPGLRCVFIPPLPT